MSDLNQQNDLSAAWAAAEKFLSARYPGWRITLSHVHGMGYQASFDSFAQSTGAIEGTGDTPAMAICNAIIRGTKV